MPAMAPAQVQLPVMNQLIKNVSLVAKIRQVIVFVRLLETFDFIQNYNRKKLYYQGVVASCPDASSFATKPPSNTMVQLPAVYIPSYDFTHSVPVNLY